MYIGNMSSQPGKRHGFFMGFPVELVSRQSLQYFAGKAAFVVQFGKEGFVDGHVELFMVMQYKQEEEMSMHYALQTKMTTEEMVDQLTSSFTAFYYEPFR